MFCRKKIELHRDNPGLPQTLISRQTVADCFQVSQLLSRATAEANELLHQANEEREALLERAAFEIWQRADAQFKRWESDRQVLCESIEQHATSVANQAIHKLLDETVEPKRLAALLRQLTAVQLPEISATLLCHPSEIDLVKQCLAHQRAALWKLQPDETIGPQTLVLKTDEGDFRISWHSMLDTLAQR